MSNCLKITALSLIALSSAGPRSAWAQSYTVTNLTETLDSQQSWAMDLNNAGQIVGTFVTDSWKRTHGFVWQDGEIVETIIPQPTDPNATPATGPDAFRHIHASAINNAGVVVGDVFHRSLGILYYGFFTPIPSATTHPQLHVSASGLNHWWARNLTNTSPMLGVGPGVLIGGNPLVRKRGFAKTFTVEEGPQVPPETVLIESFGGASNVAVANSANDDWTVVGWAEGTSSYLHAFARDWDTGVMTDLGTLGGPSSEANDINNAAQIVGAADVAEGVRHAFLYESGAMQDLGTLGGASSSAWGISENGGIVGWSWTADGEVHAYVHQGGAMIDLNDRIPAASGWVLQYAKAIGDDGRIVGWGRVGGETQAFLLTPYSLGDLNCDGRIDAFDIAPFIVALFEPEEYPARYPGCNIDLADINGDGAANAFDIEPFLELLFAP